MARSRVRLNSAGVAAILRSADMHEAVEDAAEAVADAVRAQGHQVGAFEGSGEIDLPVNVQMTTTDRAHANVTLAHPAGAAVQAKYGSLTKAAAQVGLDVKGAK